MQTMEKPSEQIIKLPEGTTDKLKDVDEKVAFHMMLRYLVKDKVFSHPGIMNYTTGRYEKLNLDYRLIEKEQKIIITRSDKPIVPVNEKPKKSARFCTPSTHLVRKNGIKGSTGTYTYEYSDAYLDSLEEKGFDRIILSGDMIEFIINKYMNHLFNKCKKSAVINWFAYGLQRQTNRISNSEIYKIFMEQYPESIEYLLFADVYAVQQFLYYSIGTLNKNIILYQK